MAVEGARIVVALKRDAMTEFLFSDEGLGRSTFVLAGYPHLSHLQMMAQVQGVYRQLLARDVR
jgi:hypothetical protein